MCTSHSGSDRSFHDSAQQTRPHPRRAERTTWVASCPKTADVGPENARKSGVEAVTRHACAPRSHHDTSAPSYPHQRRAEASRHGGRRLRLQDMGGEQVQRGRVARRRVGRLRPLCATRSPRTRGAALSRTALIAACCPARADPESRPCGHVRADIRPKLYPTIEYQRARAFTPKEVDEWNKASRK